MATPAGKILVVDDEDVVLLSIRKVFKGSQMELDTVQSPQIGLAMMESRKYDLIITDLMMPGINGLEFLDKVREIDKSVAVIMITGYATMRTALQSMQRGAFDFLAKPFTKEELSNVVHRAMKHSKDRSTNEEQLDETKSSEPPTPGRVYALRNHSWAMIDDNMHVLLGIEPSFLDTLDDVKEVELPDLGATIVQGAGFARVNTVDGRGYSIWCPLSGRVLELNPAANEGGEFLKKDRKDSWLVCIDPNNLETDLEQLLLIV